MKTFLINSFFLLLLCGCEQNSSLNLHQFESYFISRDSSELSFINFHGTDTCRGNDTCLATHLMKAYSAYYNKNYDTVDYNELKHHPGGEYLEPLVYILLKDTQISFTGFNWIYAKKLSNGKYQLLNLKHELLLSISFQSDSIIFNSMNPDSTIRTNAIPSKVEIAKPYLNNTFFVLRNEKVNLDGIQIDCFVIRYQSRWKDQRRLMTLNWDFWISPKYFIVKLLWIDSMGNQDIFLRKKEEL
jgi:hypothetical protein